MARTVQQMVNDAMVSLGVLASGGTSSSAELADGLVRINQILENWGAEEITDYTRKVESTTTSGAATLTMGPSATFNTVRPVRIVAMRASSGGIGWDVEIVSPKKWSKVRQRTASAPLIEICYPQYAYTQATLNFWPVPSATNALEIQSLQALPSYSNGSDSIALPPAFEAALHWELTNQFIPVFGRTGNPALVAYVEKKAAETKAVIQAYTISNYNMREESAREAEPQ